MEEQDVEEEEGRREEEKEVQVEAREEEEGRRKHISSIANFYFLVSGETKKEMRADSFPISSERYKEEKELMWRVWGKEGIMSSEMREGAEPVKESPGRLIIPCHGSSALHGPTAKSECKGKLHTYNHRHNGPYFLHQDYSLQDHLRNKWPHK